MTIRILRLAPVLAALALSIVPGQAQEPGVGNGGMAFPNSLPTGQVRVPAQQGRDAGGMAYPNSSGGVAAPATGAAQNTNTLATPPSDTTNTPVATKRVRHARHRRVSHPKTTEPAAG